nr:hypothetical protein [uncultured Alsobacter sp.]
MPSGSGGAVRQTMPWSVKGVDADARETAKEAARRAGMTLGEWLNAMIAENAAETEHEQREATLRDIAAQLARMDRSATAPVARPASPTGNDLQSVLNRAMAEARSQAQAVEDRTAGALDSMVKWMDRAETRRREDINLIAAAQERTSTALRDALGLVTARMDSIERTVAGDDHAAPLRKAIERLETRIEALDRREAEGFVPPKVEKSLRDLETRLVDLAGRMDRPDAKAEASAARIDRIEASLGTILERLDGAARQPGPADKAPAPGSIEDAISQIRAKQAILDGDDFMAPVRQVGDSITEALKTDIAELATRLEELRGRDTRPALKDLRSDLADLTRTVRMLDPHERLGGIERSLAGFSDVMADLRRSQPDIAPLREPLDRLTRDLGTIGTALEPLRDIGAIRADIVALATKLENAQQQPQTAPTDELARQIAALRGAVERTAAAAPSVDNVERRLAAIGATLEQLVANRAENGIEDLRSTAQDMRGIVDALPDFSAVERRFDEIARRIEGAPTVAFPLEEMVARIGAKLGEVNRPAPGPDAIDVIERRFDEIARRLEEAPAPAAAPAFPLEEMVERLGEKLDEARRPDAASTAFDALERQLASMTEALSRNDESYAAVRSLERSVSSLFEKLEETARSHASTAEQAARLAAQSVATTLAETVVQPTAPVQVNPDPRTQEALDAVQSTLQRIMDRLGSLEADIAAGRATAPAGELLSSVEKAALAAAKQQVQAPSVAEKIAAAAAAAKAAKAAEPPPALSLIHI